MPLFILGWRDPGALWPTRIENGSLYSSSYSFSKIFMISFNVEVGPTLAHLPIFSLLLKVVLAFGSKFSLMFLIFRLIFHDYFLLSFELAYGWKVLGME